jgi:hypothetical protein
VYFSGEARWFFRGAAPGTAESWLPSEGLATAQDPRTDRYLVLPGCATVGIKVREGNFEVKAQTSPSKPVIYTDAVAGFCNTWVKWSRSLDDLAGIARDARDDERWVRIRKQRTVRLFSLESGKPEEVAYGGPWLAAGCQVEKTDIEVLPGADRWWSFSFEAFGEPAQLLRNLDLTVRHVANENAAISLRKDDSMSYPEWLSAL